MVHSVVKGVRVAGLRAAVPQKSHSYVAHADNAQDVPYDEALKISETIGVSERRVAPDHRSVSDYCFRAAEGLLQQLNWDPASVEILIFVTQDPDYVIPATACVLQDKLGLPTSTIAYDINLGCSGFTYGLWTVAQTLAGSSAKRALLLAGDISTRKLKPGDRSTKPLFGDAGIACAFEKDATASDIVSVMGTDGSGAQHLIIPAGGSRYSLVPPVKPHEPDVHQDLFEKARLHMNGMEVFTFSLKAVPKLIRDTLDAAGWSQDDPDYYVWHQANTFMLKKLQAKLKLPPEKVVIDMQNWGNTSSSSIPLAICSQLAPRVSESSQRLMLAGFGVGWSWGGVALEMGPMPHPQIIPVADDDPCLGSVV